MLIGTDDGVIRMWDLTSGKVVGELDARSGPVAGFTVDPRESWIAAAYQDHAIGIWDTMTRPLKKLLRDDSFNLWTRILAGPDGDTLIIYGQTPSSSVWRISTGAQVKVLKGHDAAVSAATMTKDGSVFVSGDVDGDVIVWDQKSGKAIHRIRTEHDDIASIAFLGESRLFATGGAFHGGMKIWDAKDGGLKKTMGQTKQDAYGALKSSADGKRLATARNLGKVEIWDVESGKPIESFGRHDSVITGIDFSRDGKLLVTSSGSVNWRDERVDGQVKVWKVKGD